MFGYKIQYRRWDSNPQHFAFEANTSTNWITSAYGRERIRTSTVQILSLVPPTIALHAHKNLIEQTIKNLSKS